MQDTRYIITPRPPVRGLLTAAILSVLGAGLLVVSIALDWHAAVGVLGGVLLLVGIILMVIGFVSMRTRRSELLFTSSGYELNGPGGVQKGSWKGVSRVTQSTTSRRLTITNSKGRRTQLVFAPGAQAQFEQMLSDMVERLDRVKGYRNL